MDATAELGRNPVSKHQIQETKFSGANNADREISIFPVHLTTTSRICNLTRLILTLAICDMCDHTYIHFVLSQLMTCYFLWALRLVCLLSYNS